MHLETFIPVFLLFGTLGLLMPVVLAGIASKGRSHE